MELSMDAAKKFLMERNEVLLVDLAIHLLLGPEETRALIEPLIASGQVERIWRPMGSGLRNLCACDREECLRWRR